MTWIGFQPGFIPFLVGFAVALAVAALAVVLRFPKILIILLTALAGAGAILAGFFLAFGRISLADLQFGEVGALLRDHWIWGVLYLALAGVGMLIQWGTTENYVHDAAITGGVATVPATAAAVTADESMNNSAMVDSPASSTAMSANGAAPAYASATDTPVTDTPTSE
jgi:hypothetical protein